MAHNIDMSNNRANIAFQGSRKDVWHQLGTEHMDGSTVEGWAKAAGLDWTAVQVPAIASLAGDEFSHIDASKRFVEVSDKRFIARSDTGSILGIASDGYKCHQPKQVLDWFERYISVDPRFRLDVAGSLRNGALIWATAVFNGAHDIAGEAHIARVLMSTTFDASGSTMNRMTETRVVCNNTFDVACLDNSAVVRTTHRSQFDAAKVGRELAALAQGVARYKAVGDALAQNEMTATEISELFKTLLEIPFEAKKDDISARKMNQFQDLSRAYSVSKRERNTDRNDAWTALQAVTRYVDHDRSTRGGDDVSEARFTSAQFGSGGAMKAQAMQLLMPRIKDKVLLAA